ncbi:TonB-dependent siderophore receptor [Niveispirillum irakense]|uniref:TonB-dependent siderophore receptor n=1 Tax=Niveispirillum irakense TaxID=34011 RepID=UPI00048F886E|nr:TonB-dependent receptor [Niveispirillum irakense]
MQYQSGFRLALAASAACVALTVPMAAAQTTGGEELAEIIVVGQRQAYRGDVALKDTPQAIQVLDGALLDAVGITELEGALEMASGVAKQNNFGGLWDSFAIRGFAGDPNFPSGFLVNGFNGGRGYGGPRDASNIDRIEVLKGPNSALFGRGEPGGTVNIITKKPKFDTEGSVSVSAGSYDTYRIEGDITGPITDKIAVRINGAAEDAGSFRDTLKSKKYTASPSILMQLTEDTSFSYEAEYVKQEVPFDRGIVAVNGDLGALPISRFLGEPGDGPVEVEVLGHQAQLQHDISDDWSVLIGAGYRDTSFKGFSSDAELAGSRQTLEETGNMLSRQRRYRDYQTEHMVFRGEVSGTFNTGIFTHHLIVGADWDKFEIDQVQLRYRPPAYTAGRPITAANNAIDIFNPVYGSTPTPTATLDNRFERQKAWGVYFQDQIDLTEKLKFRFGGRYDDFDQSIHNRINDARLGNSYTKFSPQTGLVYDLTDEFSLYGGYGRGFRPNTGFDFSGAAFRPEESESYEIGGKYTSPDGRITSTLALFTMTKDNVLTADPVNSGYSLAIGKARSKGVEFDLNAQLPGDMQLYLTYSYTDAEAARDMVDPDFGLSILEGDPLINIPKNQASALLMKDLFFGDNTVTLGGGVNYVSKRLGETGVDFYLPSYTLVKLLASWQPTEQLKLSVDVNNLFDKRYYASSYARSWVAPGTPRTFTARIGYTF